MPVRTDKTLDIKGLVSPRAETVTRSTLAGMQPGQVLTVITTCRTLKHKISSLCDTLNCTVLEINEEDGNFAIQIQKSAAGLSSAS